MMPLIRTARQHCCLIVLAPALRKQRPWITFQGCQPIDQSYVIIENDSLGEAVGKNGDDGRSQAIRWGYGTSTSPWSWHGDFAPFSPIDFTTSIPPGRIDCLQKASPTLTAQYQLHQPGLRDSMMTFLGKDLQNTSHDYFGFSRFEADYEPASQHVLIGIQAHAAMAVTRTPAP